MKHFYFNFSSKCVDYTILHIPSSTTYKITEFLAGEVTLANIGFDAKCLPRAIARKDQNIRGYTVYLEK